MSRPVHHSAFVLFALLASVVIAGEPQPQQRQVPAGAFGSPLIGRVESPAQAQFKAVAALKDQVAKGSALDADQSAKIDALVKRVAALESAAAADRERIAALEQSLRGATKALGTRLAAIEFAEEPEAESKPAPELRADGRYYLKTKAGVEYYSPDRQSLIDAVGRIDRAANP